MRSSLVSRSAAAALKTKSNVAPLTTKLQNGLVVVAQDNNKPISQLILAFRAGSRYQTVNQEGLVHHIRNFVGRDAQSYPGLQLVWSSASSGASLNSFASRDVFGVQISVPRENAAYALSILGHVAAKPAFKPWELEDVLPTVHADLVQKTPYGIVFEDIHRAAFRNDSLSLSIYASKNQIGTYKTTEMEAFAARHFVAGNGALVGINVDQQILTSYAEESGAIADGRHVPNHGSPFRGGDFRRFARGNTVHVIVAGEGAGITDAKARATQAVFLAHLGRESPLKFAGLPGNQSILAKLGAPGAGFQAVHDGSGLVGAYLILEAKIADRVLRGCVEQLRSIKVDDIEGCKRRAASEILLQSENTVESALQITHSALFHSRHQLELLSEIEKVTAQDVEKFAKKAFARLAVAAYGNHGRLPYSDEL